MLYRRLARRRVLENATRRAVLEAVLACPGATTGGVARTLALNHRTAEHHLTVLREFGLLSAKRFGARLRYYRNGGAFSDLDQRAHAALADATARRVAFAVLQQPGASLGVLARSTGLPKSTVRWHLDRLRRFGLIDPGRSALREAARVVATLPAVPGVPAQLRAATWPRELPAP